VLLFCGRDSGPPAGGHLTVIVLAGHSTFLDELDIESGGHDIGDHYLAPRVAFQINP
jgi:hypothetical protein